MVAAGSGPDGLPGTLHRGDHDHPDLTIRFNEETRDTPDGRTTIITGVAVMPTYSEGSGYDMVDELQSLLNAFDGDHEFTGYIEAVGEEGDRWRLLVRDGQAVQVYPRIIWDDQ